MRSSLKGPVSYRAAIVLTVVGLVIFSMGVMYELETSGTYERTYLENFVILTLIVAGLGLFVVGAIDGAQREVEQLAEEKRRET